MQSTIEEIIHSHLPLTPASKGWHKIYCEVCGDGSRTKGPRGGWLFQGEAAFYHCFNCGIDGNFDPGREYPYSKEMRKILDSFGIPAETHHRLVLAKKANQTGPQTKPERPRVTISYVDIPDHFYKLSDASPDDVIAEKARAHLAWRNVNPDAYDFYLSSGISNTSPREKAIAKVLHNRLIIPAFKDGKMIYYQARALDPDAKISYISMDAPRSNILYFYDRLYQNTTSPLFITDGFFDAFHLRGVSIMENKLTSQQIELLERSPRQKVVVPDRKGDSKRLAEQAVELGWGVSIPDIGYECKDIDDAVRAYGKLYTIQSVVSNIREGNSAKAAIQLTL